jgi:hypothetical protein
MVAWIWGISHITTSFQPFYHKNQQVSPSAPTLANPKSNINQPFGQ